MSDTINLLGDGAASADTGDSLLEPNPANDFEPADQSEPIDTGDDDVPTETITLRVNGKKIEKTLPEVIALAQKYEATETKLATAKKEVEQARATKQQLESQQGAIKQLLQVMQRGDIETIAEFVSDKLNAGQVFNQAIMKYAISLYEQSKMSPEQREAIANKKLVAKLRQEAEEKQRVDQQRAFDYEVNRWSQHLQAEVPKAIKQTGLPDTEFVREQIYQTWAAAIEAGKNPTGAAVANYVKKRLDDAKMLNGGTAPRSAPQKRPAATRESIGRKNGKIPENQYMDWKTWQNTRGR